MAQQGASLQNYNNELVKCEPEPPALTIALAAHGPPSLAGLEDLREKREQINREIAREEDDKNK